MTAFNFKSRFADLVESGKKRQTIRANRKDGRIPKPGERLQLYTGMRTKRCRKLRDAVCVKVMTIRILPSVLGAYVRLDGRLVGPTNLRRLAIADGFENVSEFIDFFERTHGLPFYGFLTKW